MPSKHKLCPVSKRRRRRNPSEFFRRLLELAITRRAEYVLGYTRRYILDSQRRLILLGSTLIALIPPNATAVSVAERVADVVEVIGSTIGEDVIGGTTQPTVV